jgi:hypothetical protein
VPGFVAAELVGAGIAVLINGAMRGKTC